MWYLCVFYHRLLDYRRPEVESLAELFGGPGAGDAVEWRMPENHHEDSPFHFVRLPGDERFAAQVANRSLLVKGIYELWGHGTTYEELEKSVMEYPDERKLPYLTPESTFKIVVDTFGKVMSSQEQNEIMKSLTYIPFKGRVNLKKPEHKFFVIETDDYGSNNGLPPVMKRTIFFGREVGAADRHLLPMYQLKSRKYIGPTAMDAEMAFLMANQGLARPGKLVYDPFVGTGSILVAAAHFGAMTMGADIDIRVVRDGRGPDCNVWSNFEQVLAIRWLVGVGFLDLLLIFDAIICDPPYGVRAGGRKSVLRGEDGSSNTQFPEHPCFKLIYSCEQILSFRYSRVLLTMVKVAPYTEEIKKMAEEQHRDFRENHQKWLDEGNLHSAVFSPAEPAPDGKSKFDRDSKPKYRGKYV
ncbi:hypothetical protein PR202_ga01691 [Eleusine coracana subsp. coracana]|uniref:tRNA (guanine(10)-N(2))-methyltransferase n=1 Tax=Eleusine coracana subsp. coracana TaxID=191504 RepID=A0AAV5BKU6_ELECO|nr:hypothetical protein PR202_ga01004 [Eleusine coracana subsp. coracana]GJM85884.1 hypothetical protein PR202_ga01691 [Eleusine coracana subsp. coracana]